MYSSVLIITLEFKVVFIRAGLNKLLARKTDHELPLLILNDSFRLLIFLFFLGVWDIDPICVILLLVIRIDDYLLRQEITAFTQTHGDCNTKASPFLVKLSKSDLIYFIVIQIGLANNMHRNYCESVNTQCAISFKEHS